GTDRAPAPGSAAATAPRSPRSRARSNRQCATFAPPRSFSRADRTHTRRMRKAETWYRKRADRNGERAMAYTLDEFCADSRAALKAAPLPDALPQIAERLAPPLIHSRLCRRDLQRRYAAGPAHPAPRSRNRFLRARARAGRKKDRQAPQPWLVVGDLRQRAGVYRDDRVAPYQPAERGACGAAS